MTPARTKPAGGLGQAAQWAVALALFAAIPLAGKKFFVTMANEVLVMGLFAVAFNLLYGFAGMLSFGQAAYYGVGAYTVGLLLSKGVLPFAVALPAAVAAGAALALLLGPLCIRLSGVYFTMLTLAFAEMVWGIVFKWYGFTGGDNGIQGIPVPDLLRSPVRYYYFTLAVVFASFWLLRRIVDSPFGAVLQSIRENPERTGFLGIQVRRYELAAMVISGAFAALAGGLFAGYQHSIHPDMLHWTKSGEVILMSILGGVSSFFGPLMGAAVILFIEDMIGKYTEFWEIWIGGIMLAIVIFFPKGVIGTLDSWIARGRDRERAADGTPGS
ncbi:MAG: branched-chain amino acid ABC transporter permease [Deltaproteobacteria bacterium]|nr:branched-chain amino acid ABC transporter permease [Deltaproteobacteria bacterium]PWB66632.1 MAG: branched-chain amino acid ABC transporter permease [Deltaproteobacteria bacterium]